MTQKEKIELLKPTITFLYEKEGRSKSYISRLLEIDRKTLSNIINYEWKLIKANIKRLTPSNQKFANKYRQFIKSKLDNDVSQVKIAEALNVSRDYLRNIIEKDEVLNKANGDYINRIKLRTKNNQQEKKDNSYLEYNIEHIEGEEWKEILGYEGYYISNKGRIKHYIKSYKSYILLKSTINPANGREYIRIKNKTLQIARIVGFAFVDGYSEENNTIDHIDGNVLNNKASNLEWVSQSENNKRAYNNGRIINKSKSNFKKIIVDDKYEFKTIRAFAKFCGVSETQARRYIDKECNCIYKLKVIY